MATTQLPSSVTQTQGQGGLPCLTVQTSRCTGEVYLQGATVTKWAPAGGEDVLFLSPHATYAKGTAIRGGVPVIGPWFGGGPKNDQEPKHGFFRTHDWELTDASDEDGTVRLTFTLDVAALAGDPSVASFPTDFTATYVVSFGDELDLALTLTAGGTELKIEDALHSYFRVGDVTQVSLEGLDGARYADKAPGGRAVNAQSGDVKITRETDRVYASEATVVIVDPELGRRITVVKEGSASTIVWNPWEAKGTALPDLGEAWKQMLCVESGNALRGAYTLGAGEAHTLRQRVSVGK